MRTSAIITAAAILSLTLFSVSAAHSPIKQGSLQLAGGISFTSASGDLYENADGDAQTTIGLDPFVNYFVIDGLALGARLSLNNFTWGDVKSTSWGIGPQLSYYFEIGDTTETKGSLYPYLGVSFLYSSDTNDPGTGDEVKFTGTSVGFFGGATYMVSTYVGLFGQAEYDLNSRKQTEPDLPPGVDDSVSGNVFKIFTGFTFFIF